MSKTASLGPNMVFYDQNRYFKTGTSQLVLENRHFKTGTLAPVISRSTAVQTEKFTHVSRQ